MRQGFCWQRGVVAGPRGQQGSLPGGKGGCEGSVPKHQRDRSFQSTQRGEGSVAAKNEKLDRSRGNLATIVIAIAIHLYKSHLPNLKVGLLHKELLAELFVKQNKTTSIFQNKNNQYILQSV